jgi:mannose-6-phosphate isomerase
VQEQYPDDTGALLTAMLDYLTLGVGEAVYVPAGVPHSYIRGTGVEVMTSSDNVIRLGLTSKPVFVDRAIEALRLDLEPQVVRAEFGDTLWPTASPFVVRLLRDGREKLPKGAYRIVVNVEGKAIIDSDIGEISLRQGTAAVIGASDPDAWVETAGLVAVVQSTQR